MSIIHNESSILCDLDTMFSMADDLADENGYFNVGGYSIDMLIALEDGIEQGYCEDTDVAKCRITDAGKVWWAEYKVEQERLNSLALHAVD